MPPPVYPPLAKATRITGTVVMHAVIGTDGAIKELAPVGKPHPMLLSAALEAVRQWTYEPSFLNGQPVEVDLEITVNFALQ
jgi:protein TonB